VCRENLLWGLKGFDTTRHLLIDFFHQLGEGHGEIFYNLFSMWDTSVRVVIQAAWDDPETWHPLSSE